MSDLVLDAQQLLDRSVMTECYDSVCNGKHLTDDIVSNITVYIRHQLRSWTDSQDDTLRVKDDILLSLSTLLSAVKKKLCTSAALLDAIKDADFSLIVSTYFLYCSGVARFTELTLNSFVVINDIDVDGEDIRAQAVQAPLCRPAKLKLSTLKYPRHRGDMIETYETSGQSK